ncbi:Ppx/GppA phosphatase family protein [Leptothoe kymatousa]|uniref:Ppx/GppA phosphatase N-terminal domain-containing protein n=1 Tax=Leptothoe kymatousa TAU-MAC 1615 TaxID=2364775 RepID=A0ABS5Y1Y9_9CYAN|nr:hypothetical protein [Leptothoe kymatousa]MBT9311626.1 hypothetical protein [Leptothoe kymatousa TAU-MAC 1615]
MATSPSHVVAIDIGTNSILLLIATPAPAMEQGMPSALIPVIDRAQTVRLGENLIATGCLADAAMARTLAGLTDYVALARTFSPTKMICFGTAALRRAQNSDYFCGQIKHRLNLDVRILSPAEEAHYTFKGALSSLSSIHHQTPYLVIDIGGGSTEIVYGRGDKIEYQTSVPLGAVVVQERYQLSQQISTDQFEYLRSQIGGLFQQLPTIKPETTVLLTGGTATTLAALSQKLQRYDIDAIDGYPLTRPAITTLYQQLNQRSLQQRENLPGMEPGRADIILPALLILLTLLEHFDSDRIQVSVRGARYGLLL